MTKVFQSVHTKCKSCKNEVACGFTGEEFIIVTHKEYERLSENAKRNKAI